MKKLLLLLSFLFFIPVSFFAKNDDAEILNHNIVPKPTSYRSAAGKFTFKPNTVIVTSDKVAVPVVKYFQKEIERSTGIKLKAMKSGMTNAVILKINPKAKTGDEGYTLEVSSSKILITAKTPNGLFYGLQTVRQMMPPQIYSSVPVKEKVEWSLPCAKVTDSPRFKWRGVHVDCGRHFFSKEEIIRIIDALSWHKQNVFHWHLTEDQGWRIEIKKYPKLTEIGAWRENLLVGENPAFVREDSCHWNNKGQYGGFYTQEDIKEVVKYARERFVTVVPEIEFPGHSTAALMAYPEYSCDGRPPGRIPTVGGVYGKVYCPGKEETFKFLTDILAEVLELFPSEYIHIGGDECPKGSWKNCQDCQKRIAKEKLVPVGKHSAEDSLQSYTIGRIQKYLEEHGRKIIGWDEITEGGIPAGCTVMHWREYTDPKIAPRAGHDLIVATRPTCYYNWGYDKADKSFLLSQGSIMPLKQAWDFDPVPKGLSEKEAEHVIGAQACFWSEKTPNGQILEYHFFPRMCALAEATWSDREKRSWEDFSRRVEIQQLRYKSAGLNARPTVIPEGYQAYKRYDLSKLPKQKKPKPDKKKRK